MSDTDTAQGQPPAGWTWASFKATSLEAGQWIWGTAQGSFNAKMSTSQIIVDAVIGCIPLLGDATAVRDLIATSIGLSEDPKKRSSTWEWVLLFVLLLALIPVFGGVLKGVGRMIVKVGVEAEKLRGVARLAKLEEVAKSIVSMLNHFKFIGNAEKWLSELRFADYQAKMGWALEEFTGRFSGALNSIKSKLGTYLPEWMGQRIESLQNTMKWLRIEAKKRIPEVITKLDQQLKEIQTYIHTGGETTSRTVAHEVTTGERAVTYTEEARLEEHGPLPVRTANGGWKQNPAKIKETKEVEKYYKYEDGYPNLTKYPDRETGTFYTDVAAFSGKITNRPLKENERLFRLFGPEGTTRDVEVGESFAGGNWWGLGEAPKTLEEWRDPSAVLDEFNRDGYMVTTSVPKGADIKAATGMASEQLSTKIPGQALKGGGQQAVIQLDASAKQALNDLGKQVIASGKPATWTHPGTGMVFEIKPSPWTIDEANGIYGYADLPGPGQVTTQPLSEREIADKKYKENAP